MTNGVTTKPKSSLQCSADGKQPTDEWATMQTAVTKRIGELVASIRRGDFPVHSLDEQCTSRCDFSTICRIAQIRSLGKERPELMTTDN